MNEGVSTQSNTSHNDYKQLNLMTLTAFQDIMKNGDEILPHTLAIL
jgi:hypothetical protein